MCVKRENAEVPLDAYIIYTRNGMLKMWVRIPPSVLKIQTMGLKSFLKELFKGKTTNLADTAQEHGIDRNIGIVAKDFTRKSKKGKYKWSGPSDIDSAKDALRSSANEYHSKWRNK